MVMKYTISILLFVSIVTASCFPENMKEEMAKGMQQAMQMMRDSHFKSALHNVEMFKLRNGYYPDSLSQLTYVSDMDKANFPTVEYIHLENGYELNIRNLPDSTEPYPDEFWNGLGCVKSNMMREGFIPSVPMIDSVVSADSLATAQ